MDLLPRFAEKVKIKFNQRDTCNIKRVVSVSQKREGKWHDKVIVSRSENCLILNEIHLHNCMEPIVCINCPLFPSKPLMSLFIFIMVKTQRDYQLKKAGLNISSSHILCQWHSFFSAETTDSKTRLVGVELNYTKVCLNAEIKKKAFQLRSHNCNS